MNLAAGSTAWLSRDAGDSDPAVFWVNVIAALRTVVPEIGARRGHAGPGRRHRADAHSLLNELAAVPHDLVLVLDDYHAIEGARSTRAWPSCWSTSPRRSTS